MRSITNLELHLAHSCNLACESCSHYSNQGHRGMVSLDEAEDWMGSWSRRVAPRTFSLLGGEPTLHPKLPEFVSLARKHWPHASLRLVTNGFFLHRHPDLPLVLRDDPKAFLCLSIHHDAPEYQERLKPILALVASWVEQHGIRAKKYESYKNWTRRYRGSGADMEPFADGQPRRSWENCQARFCAQLFEGKIWKCGPLAYLKLQDAKYHLSEKWKPYLAYAPLSPSCSDDELREFFDREEESSCGMCAAAPQRFALPLPLARRRDDGPA
jgi:MoaA/NifB/PqqE/SkfB family radical SAM enzyme